MRLLKKISIPVSILFTLYSCNKVSERALNTSQSIQGNQNQLSQLLTTTVDPYNNYVAIFSSYTANSVHRDSAYSVEAFAKVSNNGLPVNAGALTIGSKIIYPGANNLYRYTYSLPEGKALFGTSVDAQILDSAVTTSRLTRVIMVIPKEFYPSTMSIPGNFVNRATPYTLNWASDPNNQYHQVQIQVSYYKGISQFNATGMPDAVPDLVYTVADNGSFTMPQTDLARYPKGCFVSISIARAWLDNTSGNVAYIAITEAHTTPLLVVDLTFAVDFTTLVGTCSNTCTATINGGVPPFTYEWRISDNNTTWPISPSGTLSSIVVNNGPSGESRGVVSPSLISPPSSITKYVQLKVTDATGNVRTSMKPTQLNNCTTP